MTSAEGVPSKSVMSSSWCTTFLPGNRGLPSKISAKMHPMDQMSIAVEYFAKKDPHSSGARYLPDNSFLSDLAYTSGAERAFAMSTQLQPQSRKRS